MRFSQFATSDALGVILAHTLRLQTVTLKKGTVLTAEQIALLQQSGVEQVTGVRLEPGDVDEDRAALAVATELAGPHLSIGKPVAGRCNLYAKHNGLTRIDRATINAINLDEGAIAIATLDDQAQVQAEQAVATIKLIPFAVSGDLVARSVARAKQNPNAITVHPFKHHSAALILTRSAALKESVLDSTQAVTRARLKALDSELVFHQRCAHDQAQVAAALKLALAQGCNPILICGAGITVDIGDVIPQAIRACGGEIVQFGMPVEPGNMLLLARHGATHIVNMPGCSRSPKLNGFDWVLERLLAGVEVSAQDILLMGVGGLVKDVAHSERRHRQALQVPGQGKLRIGAVILAGGSSRRMGEQNKLLADVQGVPMLARVVNAALAANFEHITLVTGHQEQEVKALMAGRNVHFVHNPDYASGIASSVRTGIASLPEALDGAMVLLGDMPFINKTQLNELIAEFDPALERDIVMPVKEGRRGNPVLWSRRYFPALLQLQGDVGGKTILQEYAANVWEVPISDDAIFTDIDTQQALAVANHAGQQ